MNSCLLNIDASDSLRNYLRYVYIHELTVQSLSRVQLFHDPLDLRLPGSSIHGISQARILKWVAMCFSRGSPHPRDQTRVSCISAHRHTYTHKLLFQLEDFISNDTLVVLIVPVSWFLTSYSSESNRGPLKKNLQRLRQEMHRVTLELLVVPEIKHTHTHVHTDTQSDGDTLKRHRSQSQELPTVSAGTNYTMQDIHALQVPPQPLLYESLSATLLFSKDID